MEKVVIDIIIFICGIFVGCIFIIYRCGYLLENKQKKVDKFTTYFNLMDRWLSRKEQEDSIKEYFEKKHIETVAIYGMGKLGKHLKYELDESGIKLAYIIDNAGKFFYEDIQIYNIKDNLPEVDVIIVTPLMEYEEIKNKLLEKNKKMQVVSLEEIV